MAFQNANVILTFISLVSSYQLYSYLSDSNDSPPSSKLIKPSSSKFKRGINISNWVSDDYKTFEREYALLLLTIFAYPPLQLQSSYILLHLSLNKSNLNFLIKYAKLDYNSSNKTKAFAILSMISEEPIYAKMLYERDFTQVLVQKLSNSFEKDDLEVQTYASTVLCNIFSNLSGALFNSCASIALANRLISRILQILKNNSDYNYEILNNMIDIIYNFSIKEKLNPTLFVGDISIGVVYLLRDFTRDIKTTNKLIEILVRTTTQSTSNQKNKKEILQVLLDLDVITILNSLLYSEDQSIVSWTIGMIHELVIHNVGIEKLAEIPGIVKLLCHHLTISKVNYANGLILRILWYLQTEMSSRYLIRAQLTEPAVFVRVISLFRLDDHETCYWIVSFLSGLSVDVDTHPWIIASSIFSCVLNLLQRENDYNNQIRITVSILISHLFDSRVVSLNLKKVKSLKSLVKFLIESKVPEVTLTITSAIINLSIINPNNVAYFYSTELQTNLFEVILDKSLDRLHLHAAKSISSLINRDILDFKNSSNKAAIPFLKNFVFDLNTLLVMIIEDLNLCDDVPIKRIELKLLHDKPRKLTKSISQYLCSTESLAVILTFYDEASNSSFDKANIISKNNTYDSTLIDVIQVLINLSGIMLGILNFKFFSNYISENKPDYDTIFNLHKKIKESLSFFELNNETIKNEPLYPYILITDYLNSSKIHDIIEDIYNDYLFPEPALSVKKDYFNSNDSYIQQTQSWCTKLSINDSEHSISEWLKNLHLTTEITLLHTAISALSSLYANCMNDIKFTLIPHMVKLVMLLSKCPFLSRGCELKLMQSLPIDYIEKHDFDDLMKICLNYSKLQQYIPPSSYFFKDNKAPTAGYNRYQSQIGKNISSSTPSSLDSSFIFESLLDSAISASVHIILQINKPFTSHLYSKEITILLANSLLEQFINSNVISLTNRQINCSAIKEGNLPTLDYLIQTCGWPIKQSSFPLYKNVKKLPFSILSNSKVFNDSWEFMTVTSILPISNSSETFSFSVLLLSSGLMQIGWCTERSEFYPVCGKGVGDNIESLAFDGYRKRRWFGDSISTEYGEKWKAGDIISSTINLKLGNIEFFINGKSMGIAFGPDAVNEKNGFNFIPTQRKWYPAVSLTSCQALQFLPFNLDPIYPPFISKYEQIPYPLLNSTYTVLGGPKSHIRFTYNPNIKRNAGNSSLPLAFCEIPKTQNYIILALLPSITNDEVYTREIDSNKPLIGYQWFFIILEQVVDRLDIKLARKCTLQVYDSIFEKSEQIVETIDKTNKEKLNISNIPFSQMYCIQNTYNLSATWIGFDLDYSKTKVNLLIDNHVIIQTKLLGNNQNNTIDKRDKECFSSFLDSQYPFLWYSENVFSFQVIH
ncbi:hypothetical protein BB561_000882 [Smittium simulii]|uniref:B30.2/SPRY domain-containing protein n=1 Tax=Smittium simulii TaxID=133385 RepID=A0A2T9YX33_9FUNG|nr:hypothetical protein BB561_000882 [Smittium simulii]